MIYALWKRERRKINDKIDFIKEARKILDKVTVVDFTFKMRYYSLSNICVKEINLIDNPPPYLYKHEIKSIKEQDLVIVQGYRYLFNYYQENVFNELGKFEKLELIGTLRDVRESVKGFSKSLKEIPIKIEKLFERNPTIFFFNFSDSTTDLYLQKLEGKTCFEMWNEGHDDLLSVLRRDDVDWRPNYLMKEDLI